MDEPSPPQHTHIPGDRETVFPLMPDERVPIFHALLMVINYNEGIQNTLSFKNIILYLTYCYDGWGFVCFKL